MIGAALWSRRRKDKRVGEAECGSVADKLSRLGLFEGAPRPALERLASEARVVEVDAGETIIKEGRMPGDFFVVNSGKLEVFSTGERGAEPTKVNELKPGDWFGEIGLIEGMPSTASVVTSSRCVLYRIPGREFLTLINAMPALSQVLVERITGGLATTHASYRPVADATVRAPVDGPAADVFRELGGLTPELEDDELAHLQALLRRLRSLPRDERRRLLSALRDVSGDLAP